MTDFFPPPDVSEDPQHIKVKNAFVIQAMTSETPEVAFACATYSADGSHRIYRFKVPSHARLSTRFFHLAKVEAGRVRENFSIEKGSFIVSFEADRVGHDTIPAVDKDGAVWDNPLKEVVILERVRVTQMS